MIRQFSSALLCMRSRRWRPFAGCAAACVLAVLAGCATPPPAAPPVADAPRVASPAVPPVDPTAPPVRPVTETFWGVSVTDPYRYFENTKDPEVEAYMRAQSASARRTLDSIPGRAALQARIDTLSNANTSMSGLQLTGVGKEPRLFYFKLAPGVSSSKLYVRDGFQGAERMVFDPAVASKPGRRVSIDFFRASPDGRHVALGLAVGGSEDTAIHLLEVGSASVKETGVVIDRIGFTDETHWAPDSKSFFYNRLPPVVPGKVNRYLNSQAFRHVIGRSAASDEMVFGKGSVGVSFADVDIPGVRISQDGKTLIASIHHGDAKERSVYIASAGELGKTLQWKAAVTPANKVTSFVVANNLLYYLSNDGAPRGKVLRASLSTPAFSTASVAVPQGDHVVAQVAVAQDGLYLREMRGGVDYLLRLNFVTPRGGGNLEFVKLPFDLAIRQLITSPARPGALLRLESWTEAPKYFSVEERSGNFADTGLHPKSNVDFSNIVELRLMAPAKDGARIPVSLIYRRDTALNRANPTLLRGYGAYGIVQSPGFNPSTLAWLERGGVLATCHVRGGGEYGDEWHRAGQMATKPNTWRDLIACAEYLIAREFTSARTLGIQGGSAGGITVGRALTERPDLFAAVIPAVGTLDTLRMEFTPNGPPNILEFGTVTNEQGFKGLLAMSSFHNVRDDQRYPAVMLMHGVNDPRVEVWHSAKMAARLQAVAYRNAGGHAHSPVLLRLDYDAGHGVGSTRSQRNVDLADVYSFLLWRFGDPAFQPAAEVPPAGR